MGLYVDRISIVLAIFSGFIETFDGKWMSLVTSRTMLIFYSILIFPL
jgi:hypothetical protein